MHRRRGTTLLLAAALATVLAAPAAASPPEPGGPGGPAPSDAYPVNPICAIDRVYGYPLTSPVCDTEASAQANATVGGYGGPCIQAYPASELCDDTTVEAEASAAGTGHAEACVRADGVAAPPDVATEVCSPPDPVVQPAGLP